MSEEMKKLEAALAIIDNKTYNAYCKYCNKYGENPNVSIRQAARKHLALMPLLEDLHDALETTIAINAGETRATLHMTRAKMFRDAIAAILELGETT